MKTDIIHLKYPLDSHYNEIMKTLSPTSRISYRNQAKNSTLCWTTIPNIDITVTEDISKCSCKKCLQQIRKRINRNNIGKGGENKNADT